MPEFHVTYTQMPHMSFTLQAETAKEAAETAARRLGLENGRYYVLCRLQAGWADEGYVIVRNWKAV